jgi:hypothetical protein
VFLPGHEDGIVGAVQAIGWLERSTINEVIMNAAHHGDKLSAPQGLRRFLLPPAGSARPFLVTFVATVCALAIPTYLAREYAAIAAAERLRGALQQEQARTVRAMRQQVEETLFSVTSDLLLLRSLVERAIAGDEDLAALRNTLRAFAESHADYLQLRFLDTQGQERVRIDHDASGIVVVPDALLQDKSQRYYVQAAETLPANGVLITPADFNREHGAVELPLRLVMRVVTPVHVNGERAGLAILNYRARILLENLRAVGSAGIGTPSVVNSLGRDALSTLDLPTQAAPRDPDVFERDFAQRHPDAWAQIRGQRTGVIDDGAGGLISHVRLEPASLAGGDRFSQPVHWRLPLDEQGPVGGWHLVSHLDAADFAAIAALGSTRSHVTFALTAALLLAVAWLLAVRVADLRARQKKAHAGWRGPGIRPGAAGDSPYQPSKALTRLGDAGRLLALEVGQHRIGVGYFEGVRRAVVAEVRLDEHLLDRCRR